ncbi:MAG: phytanoyl-CoA dioxygenase family protein [Verrucomicrobia bacterium]|nr:phytanoyl-CoA dioxygenase family protein [Verrucomicrobiota bacterium]MDE3047772.1 phytanoyl-CoA dioxygenase family protein [Verrucomicrobiota bacterium]
MASATTAVPTRGFLTQEDTKLFHSQGYLVKKGCIKPSVVQQLDTLTTQVIAQIAAEVLQAQYPCSPDQQITHIRGSQIVFKKHSDQKISILRVVGCGGIEPRFLETLRSHQMAMTFFELLGCSDLEHLICQFHPKQPKDGVVFVKHRDIQYRKAFDPDWQDVLGNGSYAICILAIDPMSPENGGLYIDRNSYPQPQEETDIVSLTMEPGDLLFMHPEILHWSDENRSEMSRRALLTGFCAWGANHRTYPGTEINVHLTNSDHGVVEERVVRDNKNMRQTAGNH